MLTIKKYANRKLYDTAERRYITLTRLAAVVRAGTEVQVLDHVTGADLTSQILTEIISEEAKRESRVKIEVLVKIIREGIAA